MTQSRRHEIRSTFVLKQGVHMSRFAATLARAGTMCVCLALAASIAQAQEATSGTTTTGTTTTGTTGTTASTTTTTTTDLTLESAPSDLAAAAPTWKPTDGRPYWSDRANAEATAGAAWSPSDGQPPWAKAHGKPEWAGGSSQDVSVGASANAGVSASAGFGASQGSHGKGHK